MNVGILSMQKIHNYGSFLQALSLKLQLEQRGHNVYFIDVLPGKQITEVEAVPHVSYLKKFDRYFFKRVENYFMHRKMASIHIKDYETYLDTGKKLPEQEKFDLVIIGSDEVFNATTTSGWGFSVQLFGKIDRAKRVSTYAASCGHTTYADVERYGIVEALQDAMGNLEHISVRDENTMDFVKCVTGRTAELHVDPVFITSFDAYIPAVKSRKPYLLVYAYANRINDPTEIAAIKAYAKKNGLEILCVGMQQRWCKRNISASAFELLSYIRGADCIVTDTFHGTVFSIKYNKRFVALIRPSNRNKLGGLLRQFELLDRNVESMETFDGIMDAPIDYESINEGIREKQERSYVYLDRVTRSEE